VWGFVPELPRMKKMNDKYETCCCLFAPVLVVTFYLALEPWTQASLETPYHKTLHWYRTSTAAE
jgi:hypothetical protein